MKFPIIPYFHVSMALWIIRAFSFFLNSVSNTLITLYVYIQKLKSQKVDVLKLILNENMQYMYRSIT